MREEIRAIMRTRGLPHLFITINPADFFNPIAQVIAGRNVDLDKFFLDDFFSVVFLNSLGI